MNISAICKVCEKSAPADSFKLHYKYRLMVCPNCYSGRTEKLKAKEEKKVDVKPPGWDQEDEYLEKAAKLKQQQVKAQFKKIPGTDQIQCTCSACKYSFKYDPFRKRPRNCPYCSEDIPKLNTFSLL